MFRWLSLLFLLACLVAVGLGYQEYQRFVSTPIKLESTQIFTIKSGQNLQQVGSTLYKQGLSEFPGEYLYWYGRYQKSAHSIKAGEYTLSSGQTLPDLLNLFIEGKVVQYAFTIIEGMTSQQLLDAIAKDSRLEQTLSAITLVELMEKLDGNRRHGEGEFAPETYYFSAGTTDMELLNRAYRRMQADLTHAWHNKADQLPYKTPYEALIMASIIEKETGIAEERPEIAGVFVRRLNIGMRLQTDPTVIYGMGDKYKGNLRRKDLTTDTVYNTYIRFGLPPSPIALPSKASIHAALNPKKGTSLYFVARGKEGRHVFSNTLVEHNKAVRRYQLTK